MQKEKEFEEIKQCTFQPNLNKKYIASKTSLKNISGIENYLDKVIQSQKIKMEKKMRE